MGLYPKRKSTSQGKIDAASTNWSIRALAGAVVGVTVFSKIDPGHFGAFDAAFLTLCYVTGGDPWPDSLPKVRGEGEGRDRRSATRSQRCARAPRGSEDQRTAEGEEGPDSLPKVPKERGGRKRRNRRNRGRLHGGEAQSSGRHHRAGAARRYYFEPLTSGHH